MTVTTDTMGTDTAGLLAAADRLTDRMAQAKSAIGQRIFGQDQVVEDTLTTLLAGGHALLIGVPGLAKTRLAQCLGGVLGLSEKRVQFTPDLMPADILGAEILDQGQDGQRSFRFVPGPVFCQLLMADEINRASPRTQSALLQAMQEGQVSIAGQYHPLPQPFHVLATQNPLEQEGTYPLPEAQLDRFLMQIQVGYPDRGAEKRMLIATGSQPDAPLPQVMSGDDLAQAQSLIRQLPVADRVIETILTLVRAGRPDDSPLDMVRQGVIWGPGPRAAQSLLAAARARAVIQGRLSPSVDDVIALAQPVLGHRMALSYAAQAQGDSIRTIITRMVEIIA